jgi:hypothetical protein
VEALKHLTLVLLLPFTAFAQLPPGVVLRTTAAGPWPHLARPYDLASQAPRYNSCVRQLCFGLISAANADSLPAASYLNLHLALLELTSSPYPVDPFVRAAQVVRGRLRPRALRQFLRDSVEIGLELAAGEIEAQRKRDREDEQLVRAAEIKAPMLGSQKEWVFTCGMPNVGQRTHSADNCPAVRWCDDELVNLTWEAARERGLKHCAWCARWGGVRVSPVVR